MPPSRRIVILAALLLSRPVFAAGPASVGNPFAPHELLLLQWNAENLFDAEDDPLNPGDDEYTPAGWRHWTPHLYGIKLEHLAAVIAAANPDCLALEEVENRGVLVDLAEAVRRAHGPDFAWIAHRDSPDKRGIDVALLSRWPIAATNWLAAEPEQREPLVARFDLGGARLTVIVTHWKSNYGPKTPALAVRAREARTVRAAVDGALAADPRAAVLVTGDFNWDATDPAFTNALRARPPAAATTGGRTNDDANDALYNLSAGLPAAARGSYYYKSGKRWDSFDNVLITRALLAPDGATNAWRVVPDSFRVLRDPPLTDADGHPFGFNEVRNAETGKRPWQQGYSDHLPVTVRLRRL